MSNVLYSRKDCNWHISRSCTMTSWPQLLLSLKQELQIQENSQTANFPSSVQGTMIPFKLKYHISLESDLAFQPKALNLFISTVKVPWHFDNIDNITFSARVRYKLGYCLHTNDIHTWANGRSLASCRC